MNALNICIIPAAGRGTRWAPVSGYLPKEMLPLVDKPVIERVIDQVSSSGCNNIIIVINKHKKVIKDYLSKNKELNRKVNIRFVNQVKPLGIAHAIYLCRRLVAKDLFGVALPDLPTISRKPAMRQLIEAFDREKGGSHIVSFDKFSSETRHFYGECQIKSKKYRLLEIKHFCPKRSNPKRAHHPRNNIRMSGNFIFKPEIFPIIENLMQKRKTGEISDRTALRAALNGGQKVIGLQIQGHTYDTGYPKGYVRANTAFFKKIAKKRGFSV